MFSLSSSINHYINFCTLTIDCHLFTSQVRFSVQYFVNHLDESSSLFGDNDCFSTKFLYWVFNPPFIVIAIPLFEWLIYPLFARRNCFPSTLKRIGAAICVSLAATAIFFILDIVGHHGIIVVINSNDTELPLCMFLTTADDGHENGLQVSGWLLLLPIILNSIAEMIGNIGGKKKN